MWGRHERTIVTNSLSKAYGLPGLRLGWIVAPPQRCAELWKHHDYTTIAPSALSDDLGRAALQPARRGRILARTRSWLTRNLEIVDRWLAQHDQTLLSIPPRAGAMLFLRYDLPIGSSALAERLREEKSVLLVPGDHYRMDGWLRIGFGAETDRIVAGLDRLHDTIVEIRDRQKSAGR
jgi:aspartate/methionine/tyrosine aminotransferase